MTAKAGAPKRRWLALAARFLLFVLVGWGVLAFGAVYPWAYWPLVGGAWAFFLAAVLVPDLRGRKWNPELAPLGLCFLLFAVAVLLQLVPLSDSALTKLSPNTVDLLRAYNTIFALDADARHPLSIRPDLTITALVLACTWFVVILGSERMFSSAGAEGFLKGLAILGLVVAIAGIIQAHFSTDKIYGFWQPQSQAQSFGPFVNRNHCAGWFLMALPATAGLFLARLTRGTGHINSPLRNRILWLSSREAGGTLLIAGAAAVMAVALLLTMSRSGVLAIAVAGVFPALLTARRLKAGQRLVAYASLGLTILAIVALPQVDTVQARFSADDEGIQQRLGAWSDAAQVAKAFPLTGTGLNTYGAATLFYQAHDLDWHYQQAHSDYLQLLAEGGILLAVPAIAAVVAFCVIVRRRFLGNQTSQVYWVRVGAVTGILAIALQELVDFSLQMPGNMMLFAVLCGIALHGPPAHARPAAEGASRRRRSAVAGRRAESHAELLDS